jgi:predicted GIY-YIG superfamily endonuclease
MKNKFVYVLKCHEYYKIGIATNVKSRLASNQTGNPYPIELVASIEVGEKDCYIIESYLHQSLKQWNERNEWFRLSSAEVKAVIDVCKNLESRFGRKS